ncbi:Mechanosensitive channel MscK precursor [Rubripirellula tenax]|uniref:Mechanosensitive channel MscK n=2 Tax=Rubripirellula tenax TaxID=2528015 RepID=A0A5C6EME0_9BACT|nr:Mechanosensitive channel MscK precursor [Rubripirellula tenax]
MPWVVGALSVSIWIGMQQPVFAQSPVEATESLHDPSLSIEQLERTIAELTQSGDGSVETVQAIDTYGAAIRNLQSAAQKEASEQAFIAETATVTARVEQLKQQRAELKDKKAEIDTSLGLPELEQLLPQWELHLSSHKKARQAAESEAQSRVQRRKEIRARIPVVQERMAESQSQLQLLKNASPSISTASFAAKLLSRHMTLAKEVPAMEAELAKYDAEEAADLIRLKIDLSTAAISYNEKCLALLQNQINLTREKHALESVRKARMEAIAAAPSLKEYAELNQQLAENAKEIGESLVKAERDVSSAIELKETLARQFGKARKKVETVGLTSSVGAMLRKQRSMLPDVSARREDVASRQTLINDTQYLIFEYEDQRQELDDADQFLKTILAESYLDAQVDSDVLEAAAQDLVKRKEEYLDALIRSSSQFFDALIELDTTDQQVLKLVNEYENYIDQRVLWIQSGRALSKDFSIDDSDRWMISPVKWSEAGATLVDDARSNYFLYALAMIPITGLLMRRRSIRQKLTEVGEVASKANCRSITPTWRAMLLTVAAAMGWPSLCLLIGWRLRTAPETTFANSIGYGLVCVGALWFAAEILRQACRPMGLGNAHFRWSSHATHTLRQTLQRFLVIALPLTFVIATLGTSGSPNGRDSLERLMFLVGLVLVAVLVFRLLAGHGLLRDYFADHVGGWTERLKFVWATVAASIPMSLACLTLFGYHYTAQVLCWRLMITCLFVVALLCVRALLMRMVLLRRRHLSMEQSRNRAAASVINGDTKTPSVAGIVTDDPQADISAHSQQSQRLINTGLLAGSLIGLWLIWVQVLPALSMLDQYALWPRSSQLNAASVAAVSPTAAILPADAASADAEGGSEAARMFVDEKPVEYVTLSDLALAILVVFVTFVLSRNGPGLLEISLLQQLPVDASVRYAITTLVSYAIVLVGTIVACSTIGLQWSQIQWLATALTFGLAFGLQEMFANFVAGLIILLERPIRVGDIVTVDDVTGVVSRIRIRATSITNWDRKEYVVPNKEFITGRLLNWTLSDKVNRVVVEVGIGYGSDTDRAREILMNVANDHPLVLKDPPAVATLQGFGDSALNMVLRCYLPTLDDRLKVIHELHTDVNKAFRAEGIEIPYPQRDLHVRTTQAVLGLSGEATELNGEIAGEGSERHVPGDLNRDAA